MPLTTLDRNHSRWESGRGFRGGAWPSINYQIAAGLADYGHRDLATDIADKTVANALRNGVGEYYDSISGRPLGIRNLGMACTMVTMMLDGLCRNHKLSARSVKSKFLSVLFDTHFPVYKLSALVDNIKTETNHNRS